MKKNIYALLCTFPLFLHTVLQADGAEEAAPAPRGGGMYQTIIMLAFAVLLGYFIIWRPEQKRRKAAEQQRGSLKKGDRVTAMGIIGTIALVKDQTVVVRMVDGSKIEFVKAAISEVLPALSEEEIKKSATDLE